MRQLSLFSQTAALARAGHEGRLYVKGPDLFYGDTAGNEVQLTAGGQPVNGGTVTINYGGSTYSSPLSAKGDLFTHNGTSDDNLAVGTDGYILSADSGETTGLKWIVAPSGSSPLTAKGDLYTRSATADDNLAVGTDGYVLTADSAQTLGIKWAAAPSGAATVVSALPTAGSTYRGTLYILEATGQPDKLCTCLRFSGGGYDWVEITRAI